MEFRIFSLSYMAATSFFVAAVLLSAAAASLFAAAAASSYAAASLSAAAASSYAVALSSLKTTFYCWSFQAAIRRSLKETCGRGVAVSFGDNFGASKMFDVAQKRRFDDNNASSRFEGSMRCRRRHSTDASSFSSGRDVSRSMAWPMMT